MLNPESVRQKRDTAKSMFPDKLAEELYVHGSSYIALEDAVAIQKYHGSHHLVNAVWDQREEGLPNLEVFCRRNWPSSIFVCQKFDKMKFGAQFPSVSSSSINVDSSSAKLLYLLSTLLICSKELWSKTDSISPLRQLEWHGWMLTWLGGQYFSQMS